MMRIGVHLPNESAEPGAPVIEPRRWLQLERLRLFKALVRFDGGPEVDWPTLRARTDGRSRYILRLYWPGYIEPAELLRRADQRLPGVLGVLGADNCRIEIGNEPNHASGKEGFGSSARDARAFGVWYDEVIDGLRSRGYGWLGFPGLAVAEFAHGERTWGRILNDLMAASDWVGCHCYWQTPVGLGDRTFGRNWQWYKRNLGRPVFVTEAGNSACDNPGLPQVDAGRQAREYVQWCEDARAGGVAGVAFFMLDGSPDWSGFRLFDRTLVELGNIQ